MNRSVHAGVPRPVGQARWRVVLSASLGRLGLLGFARASVRTARLARRGLRETGWLASAAANAPVSSEGKPLPWWPYPAIAFVAERLPSSARVFEWGSGCSTLWLSERVAAVVAVEHDPGWAAYVQAQARDRSNLTILHVPPGDSYVDAIAGRGSFEVVVIDGLKALRYRCGRAAIHHLTPDGVVLWDNSDWPDFRRAYDEYIGSAGFKRLTLRGFGPLGWSEWSFAVLYREGNCLGL